MSIIIIIAIVVGVLLILGGLAFWFYKSRQQSQGPYDHVLYQVLPPSPPRPHRTTTFPKYQKHANLTVQNVV